MKFNENWLARKLMHYLVDCICDGNAKEVVFNDFLKNMMYSFIERMRDDVKYGYECFDRVPEEGFKLDKKTRDELLAFLDRFLDFLNSVPSIKSEEFRIATDDSIIIDDKVFPGCECGKYSTPFHTHSEDGIYIPIGYFDKLLNHVQEFLRKANDKDLDDNAYLIFIAYLVKDNFI